jgi:hypothetical protein
LGGFVNIIKTILALGCIGGALGAASLTIGAFGAGNPNALPFPLDLLRSLEGFLAVAFGPLSDAKHAFSRGYAYMGVTMILTALAALFMANPMSNTVPRPGRVPVKE